MRSVVAQGRSSLALLVACAWACRWAEGVCPNACSGHGTCGEDDVCHCYANWGSADAGSGDCSQRFCPKELAYVGAPNANGNFHYYLECGGKGVCDRSTGECDCFEHFSGKGCARRTCPGEVEDQPGVYCNGHGSCEFLEELPFGDHNNLYYNGSVGFRGFPHESYLNGVKFARHASFMWEERKMMHCRCDATYAGADCSLRLCPHGNDIVHHRLYPLDTLKYSKQNMTIYLGGYFGNGTGSLISDFYDKTFALRFTNMLNESYLTQVIQVHNPTDPTDVEAVETRLQRDVLVSLIGLPNRAIDRLGVDVELGYEMTNSGDNVAYMRFMFEFYGERTHGDQKLLDFVYRTCIHCTPQLGHNGVMPVMHIIDHSQGLASYSIQTQTADYNNYVCGRRGKCDYDTGICDCFEGFLGEACGIQNDLV